MKKSATPLILELQQSRLFYKGFIGLSVLILLSPWLSAFSIWQASMLDVVLLICIAILWRQQQQQVGMQIHLHPYSAHHLQCAYHAESTVVQCMQTVCWPWFIRLKLLEMQHKSYVMIWIWRDAITSDQWRELRVLVRLQALSLSE